MLKWFQTKKKSWNCNIANPQINKEGIGSLMVIFIENKLFLPGSNLKQNYLHFILH